MPLSSVLFRDDNRLGACLVDDRAHLTLGVGGDHVSKVQRAVLVLGDAGILNFELQAAQYGQSTAAAVLKFKTDKKIINRSYQIRPDSIVGKMTIAELDRELNLLPESDPRLNPRESERILATLNKHHFGVSNMIAATLESLSAVEKAFVIAESDPEAAAGLLFVNRFAVDALERFFSITLANHRTFLPSLIKNYEKYQRRAPMLNLDQRAADYGFLLRHALTRLNDGKLVLKAGRITGDTPMAWSDATAHAMFFTPRYREFDPAMPPVFSGLFREALQGIQIHEMGHFYFGFDDGSPSGKPPTFCMKLAGPYDLTARQIAFRRIVKVQ